MFSLPDLISYSWTYLDFQHQQKLHSVFNNTSFLSWRAQGKRGLGLRSHPRGGDSKGSVRFQVITGSVGESNSREAFWASLLPHRILGIPIAHGGNNKDHPWRRGWAGVDWGGGVETSRLAPWASDEGPGRTWVSATRPSPTDHRSLRNGHSLGKGLSQVYHDSCFLPAAPQALVQRHGGKEDLQKENSDSDPYKLQVSRGAARARATASDCGVLAGRARGLRAVPGCASFGVGPRALQATRSVGLERKPCVFCCGSGGGGAGHQVHRDDQARLPPKRGGGTGSFPLDTPSIGAAGGGFLCMFLLGVLSLLVRQKAET